MKIVKMYVPFVPGWMKRSAVLTTLHKSLALPLFPVHNNQKSPEGSKFIFFQPRNRRQPDWFDTLFID